MVEDEKDSCAANASVLSPLNVALLVFSRSMAAFEHKLEEEGETFKKKKRVRKKPKKDLEVCVFNLQPSFLLRRDIYDHSTCVMRAPFPPPLPR